MWQVIKTPHFWSLQPQLKLLIICWRWMGCIWQRCGKFFKALLIKIRWEELNVPSSQQYFKAQNQYIDCILHIVFMMSLLTILIPTITILHSTIVNRNINIVKKAGSHVKLCYCSVVWPVTSQPWLIDIRNYMETDPVATSFPGSVLWERPWLWLGHMPCPKFSAWGGVGKVSHYINMLC